INKSLVYATIEDLEEGLNRKEDKFVKRSGWNLDKTDLTENDSNKVFTPKGALNLSNTLTTNFTNGINAAKEVLRLDIVKKLNKGAYLGDAQDLKNDIDSKEPIIDKKSGWNLDKTDLIENDTNKIFSAKGAFDLKTWLVTNYTTLMNNIRDTLTNMINLKLPHGGYGGSGQQLKNEIDSKEPKISKNSGFNKAKTDLAENDTNKVFSAKGAFDLKTSLENLITNLKNTLTTHVGSLVSTTQSGHMSKEDKVKLNGIANNANNYILPKATASTVGGIKVGSNLSITADGTLSAPATYTHPTTSGNKHIPTGGASNKFIKWLSDGTGAWDFIDWSFIQNKPSSFPPTSHTHTPSQVGLGNVPNTAHTTAATANTVPLRDSSGDILTRLFKSTYADENRMAGGVAFRVNNSSDSYIRFCNNTTTFKTWLGLQNVPNYAATSSVSDASNAKLATAGAVKQAYDKGVAALNTANGKLSVTKGANYRIHSDGFKEAWGSATLYDDESQRTINLPFSFSRSDYNVSFSFYSSANVDITANLWRNNTSSLRYQNNWSGTRGTGTMFWYVCGF
ncbi:MAG: head fiber protein, partial [Cetobacterium sp.]|uniref:head fiber protein n=1 Tax=Cetobacterium sp. TaxID=2071632 RepID=UPI003F2B5F37